MKKEFRNLLLIGIAVVLLVGIGILVMNLTQQNNGTNQVADKNLLMHDDSWSTAGNVPYKYSVTVVEFADFQCPGCAYAEPIVKKLASEYQGKVNFVFREFPLPQHQNAVLAAEAAEAAGSQGKFWEMHSTIYEHQNDWVENTNAMDIFVQYAKDLGIDTDKFKQDIVNEKFMQRIQRDRDDAVKLGVNATPSFFINGKIYDGGISYSELKTQIDAELKATSS